MSEKWLESVVDVGVYNVQGSLHFGSFLDRHHEELKEELNGV